MAVDTPLIHDGSLMTAFANYYNPVVPLLGAGGSGQFLAMTLQASKVLQVQTVLGGAMYGILQNTPMATEACDVGVLGITKAIAGLGGVTFGTELMVGATTSAGQMLPWVASAGNYKAGLALETAATQGMIFSMLIYNPNIRFATGMT